MILPGKRVPVRTHFTLVLSGKSIFYLPPPPLPFFPPFFPLHPQFFIFYFLLLFILFLGCGGGVRGGEKGGETIAIAAAAAAPGYKYKLNFYLKLNFK